MSAKALTFLPLGKIIQEFHVNGVSVVHVSKTAEQYKQYNGPYFCETIVCIANRTAKGKIKDLNGKPYQLPVDNGTNFVHGVCEAGESIEGPMNVERNGTAGFAPRCEWMLVGGDNDLLKVSCTDSLRWARVAVTVASATALLSSVSIKVVDAARSGSQETQGQKDREFDKYK
ncbi:hypothetical protein E8E12_001663 [Didymella heteroderae]|uniref:Uncharacterized protein n=1 Tax=Didymella heteroderae TaxID=1769908 RepID=A0A9P4WGM9_9PLEO|nr:hypothetical protein E8E12_001663 [Didymella heteroderae]